MTFAQTHRHDSARPLTEIAAAAPGDGAAAFGFALTWLAAGASTDALTVIVAPHMTDVDHGGAYPPGLSQFGLDVSRLFHVRTHAVKEALWASEQALGLAHARVLCLVPPKSSLTLTATRRLHLAAEKSGARCVLLRFDALSPSAAWTRWSVAAAPSDAAARELGRPRFAVCVTRRRGAPAGQSWLLEWNAHEHDFNDARLGDANTVAGFVAAPSLHRQGEAGGRRAG